MSKTICLRCNCNFKKQCDIDEAVFKIFKMFSEHLVKNSSPINKDSDIECVYRYDKLTEDHVRMFKKLADSNKASIYLKEVIVDENKSGKKGGSVSEDDEEKDTTEKDNESESEKDPGSESEGEKDPGSESEPEGKKKEKDSGSESDSESDSGSESGSESDTSSKKDDGMMSVIGSIQSDVTSLLAEIKDMKASLLAKVDETEGKNKNK